MQMFPLTHWWLIVQTQREMALSESSLQKSLNQQLMNRKEEMEWQLLAALSKITPKAAFSNEPSGAANEESTTPVSVHIDSIDI